MSVLKPGKDGSESSNFRPISLLSVTYKLFERILLNRIKHLIDDKLPIKQAGFRPNRGCQKQVSVLTNFIENG